MWLYCLENLICLIFAVSGKYSIFLHAIRVRFKSFRLLLSYNDSDWAIYRSTKILLSLPSLTELELGFADTTDLEYLIRCLAQLNGLHKLTLLPMSTTTTSPWLRCIA